MSAFNVVTLSSEPLEFWPVSVEGILGRIPGNIPSWPGGSGTSKGHSSPVIPPGPGKLFEKGEDASQILFILPPSRSVTGKYAFSCSTGYCDMAPAGYDSC